jgi:hypothetical protein
MSLGARCSIGLLSVLAVLALAYLKLTILKVDSQAVPVRTDGPKALPKDTEFAASPGRHLNGPQSSALGIQLKQFASQKFWIIAETGIYAPESEQMRFAEQLRSGLLAAGWIESQFILYRMGTTGFKKTKMAPFSHGGDSGVVVFADKASMPAGTPLNTALKALSIRSSLEPDDTMRNAILIFVGDQ